MNLLSVAPVFTILREGGAASLFFPRCAWRQTEPACLSVPEAERAKRFARAEDRDAFLAGRWALRMVLAKCCGCQPPEVPLELTEHGKPVCPAPRAPWFSLSHGAGWVALSVCATSEVGVDLEGTARAPSHPRVSARVFGEREQRRAKAPGGFIEVWTRKEALLKALGTGLAGAARAGDSYALEKDGHWRFAKFIPAPGLLSHVATRGAPVTAWTWRRNAWTALKPMDASREISGPPERTTPSRHARKPCLAVVTWKTVR